MSTSTHPYPPSPQVQARNAAIRAALDQLAKLAVNDAHASRARVRLASTVPPPAVPTADQIDAALTASAPPTTATDPAPARPHLQVVR